MDENERIAIKEAFARTKNDIFTLGNEFYSIKSDILDIKKQINAINESIDKLKIEVLDLKSTNINENYSTHYTRFPTDTPTHVSEKPTISITPTDTPTVPVEIEGLKYPNLDTSTRSRGVPTDRQTNQQTDNLPSINEQKPLKQHIQEAEDLLDSLDVLKKEIRLKFKQITQQEMAVFSTIYLLQEQFPEGVEYRQIATKLQLSESSIRDYTQKLISKGIPVDKIKLNNKKILLKISSKLKSIASLETLIRLREI
ncbi:MAG: hypothetical protein AABX17_03765 [Nanoarchaeota archaeon]